MKHPSMRSAAPVAVLVLLTGACYYKVPLVEQPPGADSLAVQRHTDGDTTSVIEPARRLDDTPLDLVNPRDQPRGPMDQVRYLDIAVDIDPNGRPDMGTLVVIGYGAAQYRAQIAQWIASGTYVPIRDRNGNLVRSRYTTRVRSS